MVDFQCHKWVGSEQILDAYEAERLPITDQVSRFAMAKVLENAAAFGTGEPPADLADPGAKGDAIRSVLGPILRDMNVPQFAPEGLNFGYFYDASPIISYDGSIAPEYTMGSVVPSTVPGCRMPHFVVNGSPILDLLGPDYSLLRFDSSVVVATLVDAFSDAHVPLVVLDVDRPASPNVFEHSLLLVRYDQHVVWRGNEAPTDGSALVDRLRGNFA